MNLSYVDSHKKKIQKISLQIKEFRKTGSKKKLRFSHGSTNSTRVQDKSDSVVINIAALDSILYIDTKNSIACVEPNVTMNQLVDACLAEGLLPKVVMEFPGITCGGAANGGALEASSFKFGQFSDICTEYEVILGVGEIITANSRKNSDLFYALSGSYGSLALITCIKVELIPAKDFVLVTFTRFDTASIITALSDKIKRKYDFIEAIIVDKKNSLLITGMLSDKLPIESKTFSKSTDDWFITFAKKNNKSGTKILIPIKDYLFRYNRGAFWMGEHAFNIFHVPNNKITRYILNPFMNTLTMYQGLHDTNIAQNLFIQDFYIPLTASSKFLKVCFEKLAIYPVWLCPIKSTRKKQKLSPHFIKENMLIDVGIWGTIPQAEHRISDINKTFEKIVKKIKGRKMFYAESFYTENEFWDIYDKKWYESIRKKYKAENIFPSIWDKVVVKKRYGINKINILKTIIRTIYQYIRR